MNRKLITFLVFTSLVAVTAYAAEADPVAAPAEQKSGNPSEEQLERKIDEIDAMLDRLERNIKSARKEAQVELQKKLPELRLKERELRKDLDQLHDSSKKAWQEVEATLLELRKAIERSQQDQ